VATRFHPAAACAFAAGMGVLLATATAGGAERLSIDCLMDDLVTVPDGTLAEARE
jgi:hypothetical protein